MTPRLFGLVLVAALVLPASADVDPASVPAELREGFETFRVRCSKCHTLSKPYNVRLSDEGWRRYVNKMKRRAGSGINDESGAKILAFLLWLEPRKDLDGDEAPPRPDGGTP
ncbi:MAG: hypothetical protein IPJ65_38770 [Archangiaceae bacterium]|nr:hypothetical protein [Archangiaceae bacterium]